MVELADGQEREIAFTFGSGRDLADARTLVTRFRGIGAARGRSKASGPTGTARSAQSTCRRPTPSLNFLANGWLLYQVLACRIWGRSGFYQSGGAFGFRDQLQDAMALVHAEPALLREQIPPIRGPPVPRGRRPALVAPADGARRSHAHLRRLPLAPVSPRAATSPRSGDTGVLDEKVHFLEGRAVKPDEDSYYDLPTRSEESATFYEHCVRAIRHGLRFGEHGLPLMGCGDWNDGMNLVGEHGKGESVWLAFFLYDVLVQFADLARRRSDVAFAELCDSQAAKLRENIEQHAWDGELVSAARIFDNGEAARLCQRTPSARSIRCRRAGRCCPGPETSRAPRQALAALDAQLVNRYLGIIQLFDPPFDKSPSNPGYIKGYVPGVRENGGQYTHAAVWAVMAFAAAGDAERAWELFRLINPGPSRQRRDGDREVQGRAIRRRRRRLHQPATRRPRRMDLVHRLGGMDVSPDHRVAARPAAGSRSPSDNPPIAGGVGGVRCALPVPRDDL